VRVIAGIAAVPVLLVGWLWHVDRSIENRLAPIASAVAGRDVKVSCQGFFGELFDADAVAGHVRGDANGVPEAGLHLDRQQCSRLRAFSRNDRHPELECLASFDWTRPSGAYATTPCFREAEPTVVALLILAHEAYHTAGMFVESYTNCYAMQSMAYVAVELGASERDGALAALAFSVMLPGQGPQYGMDGCVRGSKFDLFPETPEFPSEIPVRPTLGKGGMPGVASGAVAPPLT